MADDIFQRIEDCEVKLIQHSHKGFEWKVLGAQEKAFVFNLNQAFAEGWRISHSSFRESVVKTDENLYVLLTREVTE